MFKVCLKSISAATALIWSGGTASAQATLVAGWDFGQFAFDGFAITSPGDFTLQTFIPANFSGVNDFNPVATHDENGVAVASGLGTLNWSQAAADAQQLYGLGAAGSASANTAMPSFPGTSMSNFLSDPANNALILEGFSGQSIGFNVDLTGYEDFSSSVPNMSFAAFADSAVTIEWSVNGTSITTNIAGTGAYAVYTLDLPASAYGANAVITGTISGNAKVGFDNIQINGLAVELQAPVITGEPTAPSTAIAGSFLTLAVSVEPLTTGTLTYQWFKDDVALTDGTGVGGSSQSTLQLGPLAAASAGVYKVRVFNGTLFTESETVSFGVLFPPVVTRDPADVIANPGGNMAFTAEVNGSAPFTYLWEKDGSAIPADSRIEGRDAAQLRISNITLADAGSYRLTVINAAGEAESRLASLQVVEIEVAPEFQVHPSSVSVNESGEMTLRAEVTGSPAPSLRWFKGDVTLADGERIAGAATNILKISNVTRSDAGSYRLVATNAAGAASSESAILDVRYVPVVSDEGQPVSRSVLVGADVVFEVSFDSNPPPSIQWLKDGEEIPGENQRTLSLPGVDMEDAGSYSARLTNAAGSIETASAVLTVNQAPVIAAGGQPASQVLVVGASATFLVTASGFPAPSYQWYKGNKAIEGATASRYAISRVQASDAGSYHVVVANAAGAVVSETVSLTVVQSVVARQTAVQTFAPGSDLQITSFFRDDSGQTTYQWYLNGRRIPGASLSSYLVTNASAANSGTYTVKLVGRYGVYATLTVAKIKVTVAGTYDALLRDPESGEPVGRAEVLIASSGSYTGTLAYEDDKRYAMKGKVTFGETDYQGASQLTLRRSGGLAALELQFALDAREGTLNVGVGTAGGEDLAGEGVGGLRAASAVVWSGRYDLVLAPPSPIPVGQPEGTVTLAATIASKGALALSGRLADGTKVTASVAGSLDRVYAVFMQPYKKGGHLAGELKLVQNDGDFGADVVSGGLFAWLRPADPKAKAFPGGIDLLLTPALAPR